MIADYLRLDIPIKDKEFDMIYPSQLRKLSKRHFTSLEIAKKASELLVTKPKQKILDIGSGVGKFCFIASSYTDAIYTGVDYRKHFIELSNKLVQKHRFKNVHFVHSNILTVDFSKFDGFYFFNSFQEQIDPSCKIDETVELSPNNFKVFSDHIKKEWSKMPIGTRVVTYHAYLDQIPNNYQLISMHFDGLLKCWEKTNNPVGRLL